MKDLKDYFTESAGSCDARKIVINDEVTAGGDGGNDNATSDVRAGEETSTDASRKRGRIKIKISKNNSRGKVCDIVESSGDLVNKTPSPFASRDNIDDDISRNDTNGRTKSCETVEIHDFEKITNFKTPEKTSSENVNLGDENDNRVSNNNCKSIESIVFPAGKNIYDENIVKSMIDVDGTERERSNAFQVLMTRKKPPQYKANCTPTPQEQELAAKIAEAEKSKIKRNREKLISLADKKGYSKRKLNELEEAERIEMRLEKRAKVFKQFGKIENEDKNSPVSSRRVSPGSLHNYFSKATPERREKDITIVSTVVAESELHVPDSSFPANVCLTVNENTPESLNERMTRESLGTVLVAEASKSLDLPVKNEPSNLNECRKKKPRWSLRINLHCNDRDDEAGPIVEKEEKTKRRTRDSRSKGAEEKSTNRDEEDRAGPSAECSNKKRLSRHARKSKSSSLTEIRSCDTENSVKTEIPIVLSEEKPEIAPESVIFVAKVANKAEKLAPLFVKRQKPDRAVMEARRAFLHSVSTENHDRTIERKIPIVGLPFLPFPSISHVTQLDNERKYINSDCGTIFPRRESRNFAPKYDLGEFRAVTCLSGEKTKNLDRSIVETKSEIDEVLREIESRCTDAREIWTRISSRTVDNDEDTKKLPKRRGKKIKSTETRRTTTTTTMSDDDEGRKFGSRDCAWTEKYRPRCTRDIVGNEEGAKKFRKWLAGWKINSVVKSEYSSGDEFYSSDCSYASATDDNRVAVLLGPHGSGKTASVYAIAEELGYRVIEVNASSKRGGKKILRELEEATKSHRIRRNDFMPLKTAIGNDVETTIPQNSLILVEDVDLVFEEDEGFISATCQLASNTKRPIVMTGRKACPHLSRIAPQQIRIYYQIAAGTRVSALLELITLAETGYRLPPSCLDRLLQNGDLRKALLQLQYLLISGKPDTSVLPRNFHQSLWQDMRRGIYKPAIRGEKKTTRKKLSADDEKFASSKSIIDRLADDLDKISFLSTMIEIDDPTIEISPVKPEASLSLHERTHDYSSMRVTSGEIAKWLGDRLLNDEITNDRCVSDGQNFRQLSLKKELNVGVNLALSQISPYNLDRRTTILDYLSSLRTICRAEEARTTRNNKRGNRFFHYLQSLRLPALSTRPNILSAACKMMREKDSES